VAHVAAEYPQLCEAETEAFARLLGTPVQRLATIAHGDGICTTHVTAPSLRDGAASTRGRRTAASSSATARTATARNVTADNTATEVGGLSA
jgi:alkanesulfonate monooxygenase SsuD/methylene tetrahydromethanopterin reductase-like flavin-dependent oxidoreductase (luciferase family)